LDTEDVVCISAETLASVHMCLEVYEGCVCNNVATDGRF